MAELVAAEVAALERQIERRRDLGVLNLALENRVDLFIDYEAELRKPLQLGFRQSGHSIFALGARHTEQRILHLECSGWNARPPLAELRLPDRRPLPPELWPLAEDGQGIVHGHRKYARPFFCRPGMHEFHSHTQHSDEPWDRHRPTRTLDQIAIDLLEDLQTKFVLGK